MKKQVLSKCLEGCVYPFQKTEQVGIIGLLVAWVERDCSGWIKLVFSENEEQIKCQFLKETVLITLNVDVALKLAGMFLFLIAQNKEFRKLQNLTQELEIKTPYLASCEVQGISQVDDASISDRRGIIELRFPKEVSAIRISLEDGQIDLQLREELAHQVGLLIFEQLGILAAHLSLRMLQDASPE